LFRPTASCENLRRRAKLLATVREFFAVRGFLEVETPILSADTVVDRHLDPFPVVIGGEPPSVYWLQTSPEFAMKRLLAAGATAIFQIARVFRREELGNLHNPEFTMVEWYRAGDGLSSAVQLLDDLCDIVLNRGRSELLTYGEAFQRYALLDPHQADTAALVSAARRAGISAPETLAETDRDGWLDLWLVERIQPHLGTTRPVILYDFPASQAALAQIRPGPPAVAERFELYVSGVELANGYHELTDPAELRRRNAAVNAQRRADGKPPMPEESRLLAAMEAGLPDSTGVALGFDRLAMVALGAKDLREVIAFPFDCA
jgi:lysyl-tRNA synthetase class 2